VIPYRRIAPNLADRNARLRADVIRYIFIAVDLHHLLLAGLPALLCFRPEADIANVNVSSKPPHLGASRAYLEDVTAAEFCEEGGHGLEVGEAQLIAECYELRLV
jgi:hypothetical protein